MYSLGWTEMLLIAIVTMVVIQPKDLPVLFRNVGRFLAKVQSLSKEFRQAMEDAADETGLRDAAKTLKSVGTPRQRSSQPKSVKSVSEVAKPATDKSVAPHSLREISPSETIAATSRRVRSEDAFSTGAAAAQVVTNADGGLVPLDGR